MLYKFYKTTYLWLKNEIIWNWNNKFGWNWNENVQNLADRTLEHTKNSKPTKYENTKVEVFPNDLG